MVNKMMQGQEQAGSLGDLLETEDEQQQAERVQMLLAAAQAPVVVMTVVFDPRSNKTDILLNGDYTFDTIYNLVDTVHREIANRERQAILARSEEQASSNGG